MLEAEFDMQELHSRLLRDLALADITSRSSLNTWMRMATMGLSGDFDTHPALLGLTEVMVRLKDKEQRGVGLQNMSYSEHLDTVPNLSIGDIQDVDLSTFSTSSGMQHQVHHSIEGAQGVNSLPPAAEPTVSSESFQPPADVQARKETENRDDAALNAAPTSHPDCDTCVSSGGQSHGEADAESRAEADTNEEADGEGHMESDHGAVAFLTDLTADEGNSSKTDENTACIPSNHVPCTGLRDENVQAYVANAVQLVGGSRPRYVIARELFPRVFGNDKKVRIVDKLNIEQRVVLQDAVFSECLWRVDKEGRCVRSLRCKRFVPVSDKDDRSTPLNHGVCRACRDLRTVPNFRSVLSRSKAPKKLENIKYVPSVYTESDPFLRKLSKNSAFRGLYQTVKRMTSERSDNNEGDIDRRKQVCFWLRFARMGVFGHFHSHPVFEGLMKSMVEVKDKERRGVGKQNMQYSCELDDFMQNMAQMSTEAFELFSGQFCGRTLRSQKVKRRSTISQAAVSQDQASDSTVPVAGNGSLPGATTLPPTATLSAHQHYLMQTDDLLGGRSLSSEESQRFMDRMLDEVRLSVSRDMLEQEHRRGVGDTSDITPSSVEQEHHMNEDDGSRLGPETYLDDEGVLTTEI
ncbi:hypothetical protein JM18_003612 [Phytophthora kernoviae]|uniref:Uncharacterized protein n=1 Tax=Phytophthora kernoviae TaxID=325452 RepID=A0A8T0M2S8_9STRA|nr:hypothetical protein JM16_004138 [Phytophthora kernoviae]KAG2527640.1 hypothetical protein JM18_003612 [Phytophthora kernoviae]